MSRKRVLNVIKKEWQVVVSDTNSILLTTLLPLLIIGEFILVVWLVARFGSQAILANTFFQAAISKMVSALPAAGALEPLEQLRLFLVSQFSFFLLLIPTMVAISLATFSIVDEKVSGSLEALLATPVRTWELLLGKALSGAIPAVIITWVCAAIFVAGVAGVGWGDVVATLVGPAWFLFLLLLTPAVSLLSFLLGIIGSSRARDARSAQTLVVAVILPLLVLIAVQVTGIVWFTPVLLLALSLAAALVDAVVLRIAVRLFQRESIVVRWR